MCLLIGVGNHYQVCGCIVTCVEWGYWKRPPLICHDCGNQSCGSGSVFVGCWIQIRILVKIYLYLKRKSLKLSFYFYFWSRQICIRIYLKMLGPDPRTMNVNSQPLRKLLNATLKWIRSLPSGGLKLGNRRYEFHLFSSHWGVFQFSHSTIQ